MLINNANLRTLYIGFKTTYQNAFDGITPLYDRVAMVVPSTTKTEEYGWLGQFPRIREWLGDRVVQSISAYRYQVTNKDWEFTVGVKRPDLEDDNIGLYAPMVAEIGRSAATFPDEQVWPLIKAGNALPCYDGQNFFDTDHPVLDQSGAVTSVSNWQGGTGAFWALLDTSRAIKPVLYQNRKSFQFVRMDQENDEAVFTRKEVRYGVDGRSNVGFGFWQLAVGSCQPLTPANYAAARAALTGMKGDYGRPLGVMPDTLVFDPSNEGAARSIVVSDRDQYGATNPWAGTAKPLLVPWLA